MTPPYVVMKVDDIEINSDESYKIIGSCGYVRVTVRKADGTKVSTNYKIFDGQQNHFTQS